MAKSTGVWTPTNCQVCGKEFKRDYIAITTKKVEGATLFLYCCVDCHYRNSTTRYEKRYFTLQQAREVLGSGDIQQGTDS